MNIHKLLFGFISTILFISLNAINGQTKTSSKLLPSWMYHERFYELNTLPWKSVFQDSCIKDWQANWSKDGLLATISNGPEGMTVSAGPKFNNDDSNMVLWTKKSFKGDLKIEYDFTRIDTINHFVNIIYIQATGSDKKPYCYNIHEWKSLRQVPSMDLYYEHMNTYHISYAVSGANEPNGVEEYLRGRRYIPERGLGLQGTAMKPEYHNTGTFTPGVTYRITIIKKGKELFMQVRNKKTDRIFYFNADQYDAITEGWIGLRQMRQRISRYANFKVSELAY